MPSWSKKSPSHLKWATDSHTHCVLITTPPIKVEAPRDSCCLAPFGRHTHHTERISSPWRPAVCCRTVKTAWNSQWLHGLPFRMLSFLFLPHSPSHLNINCYFSEPRKGGLEKQLEIKQSPEIQCRLNCCAAQSLSPERLFVTTQTVKTGSSVLHCLPELAQIHCPLSWWCQPTISSSVVPFSHLQSFPASGSFTVSQLFTSGGQSIRGSASASVLPMNTQGWSPLGWTGLISLQSKGLNYTSAIRHIVRFHRHWVHRCQTLRTSLWPAAAVSDKGEASRVASVNKKLKSRLLKYDQTHPEGLKSGMSGPHHLRICVSQMLCGDSQATYLETSVFEHYPEISADSVVTAAHTGF